MSESKSKSKEPKWVEIAVPKDLVRAIMAAETEWIFDPLEGVIEAPTITLDGRIVCKAGYDRDTGLYYDPRNVPQMPPFKAKPSADDALDALDVLHDVLDEFAFSDYEADGEEPGTSKATAVAAILAACSRRVLPMCPVFLIDAPGQSNGKTLLADLIATIPTGRGAGATTWSRSLEEQRKSLSSILRAGDLVVNFDNVVAPIGGEAICAVTTAQASFKDRLLGSTIMLELPTCALWLYTGNNMTVKDDMATRVLRIRLDAKCERPDLRQFKRSDLLAYVRSQRGALIHAALTILKAYIVVGKPKVSISGRSFQVNGRFNAFSDLIASALVWLDQPDPLHSQRSIVATDPVREAREAILSAWRETYGFDNWITAKQLKGQYGALPDALDELEAGGDSPNATASKLKSFEGLIINGMKLERRAPKPNKPSAWCLRPTEDLSFLDL